MVTVAETGRCARGRVAQSRRPKPWQGRFAAPCLKPLLLLDVFRTRTLSDFAPQDAGEGARGEDREGLDWLRVDPARR